MASPSKTKGDRAEREVSALLSDHLGVTVRRKLGAGRMDDEGDLEGLADWTLEVKNYADIVRGIREGLDDCEREQANAGTPFGATFIRRRGGRWFVVMSVEQFCAVARETAA